MLNRNIRNAGFALALLSGATGAGIAAAAEFTVPMDQGRMITFPHPVATVFVGNPLIADVTIVDGTRAFLTGKNFGATNLITLDENGDQLSNDRINVSARMGGTVTLHHGVLQTTLACAGGRCQEAPVPSDHEAVFDRVTEQIDARSGQILGAAGGE